MGGRLGIEIKNLKWGGARLLAICYSKITTGFLENNPNPN